jgi:DNA polymerase-3 subunit beta
MVKFTSTKDFVSALKKAKAIMSGNTIIPTLSNVKIVGDGNGNVEITASNGGQSVKERVAMEHAEPFGFLVMPDKLEKFLEIDPTAEFDIEFNTDGQTGTMKSLGKKKMTFAIKSESLYPKVLQDDLKVLWEELPASTLKSWISDIAFAASTQESRPVLTGLNLKGDGVNMRVGATDSHRLSMETTPNIIECAMSIPAKPLQKVLKLFGDDENLRVTTNEVQVVFEGDTTTFYSRLLEGNYPDITRLVPQECDFNMMLTVDKQELKTAIDLSLLAQEDDRDTVLIEFLDGAIKIRSTHNSGLTSFDGEEIEVDYSFYEPNQIEKIAFNPSFMKDAIKHLNGSKVCMNFTTGVRPFVLKSNGVDNAIQLITPIRIG